MFVNYSDQEIFFPKDQDNGNSIFLAGPIPRDKTIPSWRKEALNILKELEFDGIVYVPEYSDGTARTEYVDQAMWERKGLDNATCIVFWIPRDIETLPAFTTNVEFGEYVATRGDRVAYGRPDQAPKMRYLDWLFYYKQKRKPCNTLEDTLIEAVIIASEKRTFGITQQQFIDMRRKEKRNLPPNGCSCPDCEKAWKKTLTQRLVDAIKFKQKK